MLANAQASIVHDLALVAEERRKRLVEPELHAAVVAVKAYQQRRFTHTYADLLPSTRYGAAARFFLDELYGPLDFSHRDAQFARVVPALVRVFNADIVRTVATLARLHALSESLDSAMGRHLGSAAPTAATYGQAWRRTGKQAERETQIALTLAVGTALDRHTRSALLRHSLRLMRGPARAAGLAELQRFLETGFDAFKAMQGAADFLDLIGRRERELASALFAGGDFAAALLPPEPQ